MSTHSRHTGPEGPGLFPASAAQPAPAGDGRTHLLQPNMLFACGQSLLDLRADHWTMSINDHDWANITCPDCRAPGRPLLARVRHRMQQPTGHTCTPEECWWMTAEWTDA